MSQIATPLANCREHPVSVSQKILQKFHDFFQTIIIKGEQSHYNAFSLSESEGHISVKAQHIKWLENNIIRNNIWDHTQFENNMLPRLYKRGGDIQINSCN